MKEDKNILSHKEKVSILRERINSIVTYRSRIPDIPITPAVIKARKVINEWSEKNEANKARVEKAQIDARNRANECLVLGDIESAIEVCRIFEEGGRQ